MRAGLTPQVDVSIVVPCYNHGRFLVEAVASAHACREPRCEVIVVNDGSDDPGTLAVFEDLRRGGVTVIDQVKVGPLTAAAARNTGIAASRGRYILPLDADNRVRPRYPAVATAVLDRDPEVAIVYGDSELFGEQHGIRRPGPFDLERLLRGNYIDTCAVFRREVWEGCGGYHSGSGVEVWEDWDFWLSAAERGYRFHYVPEVLFDYRVRSDSVSRPRGRAEWRARRDAIAARHRALFARGRRDLRAYAARREPALYSRAVDARQTLESWLLGRLRRAHSER
jgi:glycosyltransferase involved in cell wall biosynthesis